MRTNFAPTIEPIEINWQINPMTVVSKGKSSIFLKKDKRYLHENIVTGGLFHTSNQLEE